MTELRRTGLMAVEPAFMDGEPVFSISFSDGTPTLVLGVMDALELAEYIMTMILTAKEVAEEMK